mgnify:CR=1 FL=1
MINIISKILFFSLVFCKQNAYVGPSEQNTKLYNFRSDSRGASFEGGKTAWESRSGSEIDYSYNFPIMDYLYDSSAHYWRYSFIEKSEKNKALYKKLYDKSIKKLKDEALNELIKSGSEVKVFKINTGSYSFSTSPTYEFLGFTKRAEYLAQEQAESMYKPLMQDLIKKSEMKFGVYYVNSVKYQIFMTVNKNWISDYAFETAVKQAIKRSFISHLKNNISTAHPSLINNKLICDKEKYILNIYHNGKIELIDQANNKSIGSIGSVISKNECKILFEANDFSKVKIKLEENGTIQSISMKTKCDTFSSLPMKFIKSLKNKKQYEKKYRKDGYVVVNQSEYGTLDKRLYVNFFDPLDITYYDVGIHHELFPIIYLESEFEGSKATHKIIKTYGFLKPSNVFYNEKYNTIPSAIISPFDSLESDKNNIKVPYKEFELKDDFNNIYRQWDSNDRFYEIAYADGSWYSFNFNNPERSHTRYNTKIPSIKKSTIISISKAMAYDMKYGYYVLDKGLSQSEISKIKKPNFFQRIIEGVTTFSCLEWCYIIIATPFIIVSS